MFMIKKCILPTLIMLSCVEHYRSRYLSISLHNVVHSIKHKHEKKGVEGSVEINWVVPHPPKRNTPLANPVHATG